MAVAVAVTVSAASTAAVVEAATTPETVIARMGHDIRYRHVSNTACERVFVINITQKEQKKRRRKT